MKLKGFKIATKGMITLIALVEYLIKHQNAVG